MKSIKPGRGPSFMSGIASIVVTIFGVFWTITAASMGAPAILPLFGAAFTILGIIQTVYQFKNATGRNRYSTFDITENDEEPDPLNQYFNRENKNPNESKPERGNFCPYCGVKIESDFVFCKQCGKKI